MKIVKMFILLLLIVNFASCNVKEEKQNESDGSQNFRLNQIGFYPQTEKIAVITANYSGEFYIKTSDKQELVYTGKVSDVQEVELSFKETCVADFSDFTQTGKFVIEIPGIGTSKPFEIKEEIYSQVATASLKGFYFQRMSTELTAEFAGKWARPLSHPDSNVMVHSSAASKNLPEGSIISAPYGWYDAGDYNKYIVNSGITTATLLSLYEDFPESFSKKNLQIPESKNNLPDILDEILWNLRWMLKMQDKEDGGVYHKLTAANFDGMIMPHEATSQRYVVQKSTAAALNFAAVCAQAARILKNFENDLPQLADSCQIAAEKAWVWAIKNPEVAFNQTKLNEAYEPDIQTGEYGDSTFEDEFFWAATELFITTQKMEYANYVETNFDKTFSIPSWDQVRALGYYSLLRKKSDIPNFPTVIIEKIQTNLLSFAENMILDVEKTPFRMVMGKDKSDFIWGSSSVAANQGILLLNAYKFSNDKRFYNEALANLDYLLGRNATNFSFVTGFGHKTPMFLHHRQSQADGIAEPIPGLLSGGPNVGKQDKCNYPYSSPEESYVDVVDSYASNEIAINWQAAFSYLVNVIEIMQNTEN